VSQLRRPERVQRIVKAAELVVLGAVGSVILAVYLFGFVGKKVIEELTKQSAEENHGL
jgi:hypothetical protein